MLKVLIVDDEPTMRKGLVMGVDWASMDCVVVGEAANGEEGLEAFDRYHPGLIITDIRMPRMDGLQMLSALREKGSTVHVILLTAYDDFDYIRSALQMGAVDYLLKPFRDNELREAVARLQRWQSGREQMPELSTALPGKGDKSKYVLQAVSFIAEHYTDVDISITSIADALGVSEGHLSHIFKKETSYTVISYLTQYRIHAAMELLKDCRYKVYEVAEQVGYRDVSYFSSTFKKLTGMSPSEYQDRC